MHASAENPDKDLSPETWTLAEALRSARDKELLDYHIIGYEVLFMMSEFGVVLDRDDFERVMTMRVNRRDEDCVDQVLNFGVRNCTAITFDERGKDARRRFKAAFGWAPLVFQYD